MHDPEISKEEKRAIQSKGGKTSYKTRQSFLRALSLKDSKDVVVLLEDTINRTRNGSIEARIANCLGFLSGHLLRALELSEMEKRLEEIEKHLEKKDANKI